MRDFVYVDDVVDVILWCMRAELGFEIFNVGTGKATSFQTFVEALYQAVGQKPKITYVAMPEGLKERYQYFTEASLVELRRAGYNSDFKDVREGVQSYVELLSSDDCIR